MSDIPDGWCLVPLEPTPAMLKACKGALYQHIASLPAEERGKFKNRKKGGMRIDQETKTKVRWAAMLAAADSPALRQMNNGEA